MSEWIKLIIWLAILIIPFQIIGFIVSRYIEQTNARKVVVLLPAMIFFVIFLGLYLWNYYNPKGMELVDAIGNLILLVMLVIVTILNFLCALVIQFIFRKPN
jgi:hypothetical protein